MSFSFASFGHALASGFENVAKGVEWLITEAGKVETSAPTVEGITSVIAQFVPQAGLALTLEKLGYGSLGVIVAALQSGDAALKQNLINAGADESFIQQIEAVIASFPSVIAGAKAAFESQTPQATAAAKAASKASVITIQAPKGSVTPAKIPAAVEAEINAGLQHQAPASAVK